MIFLKDDSVNPANLSPQLLFGLIVANQVYEEYQYGCHITSLNDATHSRTSLHYRGDAADLRTRHMADEDKQLVRDEIKKRLNVHWDVILEGDHIHLEFQPRR